MSAKPYEFIEDGQYAVTDHAEAAAEMLEAFAKLLRTGTSLETLGPQVILVGRLLARRT